MSKNRDLIYDMAEAPETEDFEQLDSEPLQLGGVGEDAPAANDRQVTTPGDVHVAPQMPTPIDGTLRQFALRVPSVIDECSGIMVFGKRIKSLVFSTDLSIIATSTPTRCLRSIPSRRSRSSHRRCSWRATCRCSSASAAG